jgi:hypothetical protein
MAMEKVSRVIENGLHDGKATESANERPEV